MSELLGRPSGAWAWAKVQWGRAWPAERWQEEEVPGRSRSRVLFWEGRKPWSFRKVWGKVTDCCLTWWENPQADACIAPQPGSVRVQRAASAPDQLLDGG